MTVSRCCGLLPRGRISVRWRVTSVIGMQLMSLPVCVCLLQCHAYALCLIVFFIDAAASTLSIIQHVNWSSRPCHSPLPQLNTSPSNAETGGSQDMHRALKPLLAATDSIVCQTKRTGRRQLRLITPKDVPAAGAQTGRCCMRLCSRVGLNPCALATALLTKPYCTSMVRWLRSGCPVLGMCTSSTPLLTCKTSPGGCIRTGPDLIIPSHGTQQSRQMRPAWQSALTV
jgi:hypothetical protein